MHTRTVLAAASMTALTAAFAAAAVMQLGGFASTDPENAAPTIVTVSSAPVGGMPGETTPLTVPAATPAPATDAGSPKAAGPSSAGGSGRSPSTTAHDGGDEEATITTVGTTQVTTTSVASPARTTASGQPIPAGWQLSSSWLASGKPIPAYPSGCAKGQLEDNGRWNCE